MKDAAPLINILKTKNAVGDDGLPKLVFGDLGEQVERAMKNYINDCPQIATRGRPGDLWFVQCVALLAAELMADPRSEDRARPRRRVRQSEKNTIRAIERLLKLAGHGDLITREKIRHVIRQIGPVTRKDRVR